SSPASRASRRSRSPAPRSTPSPAPAPRSRWRCRPGTPGSSSRRPFVRRRERLAVVGVEAVGAYTLVRVERGSIEPGIPGQFFMLAAPGRLLPRPFSLCTAPKGELGFLVDPVGPGTQALAELESGDRIAVFGPLGNGFRLDVPRPLLVGGGIGIAPFPYLSEALERPPTILRLRAAP